MMITFIKELISSFLNTFALNTPELQILFAHAHIFIMTLTVTRLETGSRVRWAALLRLHLQKVRRAENETLNPIQTILF